MSKTVTGSMQVKEIAEVLNNVGAGMKTETFIDANVAALTLTTEDSGKIILLNRAAGCDITLPASTPGLTFIFKVITAVTSNDYSVKGAAETDLFVGGIVTDDTDDSSAKYFLADGSDDDVMSMNGSTTGGLIGTAFKLTCVAAAKWFVEGLNVGSGAIATPFA